MSRQHGATKRKWERENRVLPFDHLQGVTQIAQDRHSVILKQPIPETRDYSSKKMQIHSPLPISNCRFKAPTQEH
jgi:hypothetical protein